MAEHVIPPEYADLLESNAFAHVATIGPRGEPQNNPVWFGWDGTYLRFTQVTTHKQKYWNVQREPRVAISMIDPENPYRYLEIRGTVERVDEDPEGQFIDEMAQKYLGEAAYPFRKPGDRYLVFVVRPDRTTQQMG